MRTYDPTEVQINIGTLTLTGVADGTFIKISRNTAERYKRKVGAKGEVSRSRVSDKSGTIEVTLKHTSPSNQNLYMIDKNPAAFPVTIIESGSSKFVASATEAWVEKIPNPEFGAEESNAVWVFGCSDLDYGQI
jgi:Bacteriophage KPP10, Structural protein ORF10